jgi:hypothetical protein
VDRLAVSGGPVEPLDWALAGQASASSAGLEQSSIGSVRRLWPRLPGVARWVSLPDAGGVVTVPEDLPAWLAGIGHLTR